MTLPKPATKQPFGDGAEILIGVYCHKCHVPMICNRDCEVCDWKEQTMIYDMWGTVYDQDKD